MTGVSPIITSTSGANQTPRPQWLLLTSLYSKMVPARMPTHHDHRVGEWIGIQPEVDHVAAFKREG